MTESSSDDCDEYVSTVSKSSWKSKYLAKDFGNGFPGHLNIAKTENVPNQTVITSNDLADIIKSVRQKSNQVNQNGNAINNQTAVNINILQQNNRNHQPNGVPLNGISHHVTEQTHDMNRRLPENVSNLIPFASTQSNNQNVAMQQTFGHFIPSVNSYQNHFPYAHLTIQNRPNYDQHLLRTAPFHAAPRQNTFHHNTPFTVVHNGMNVSGPTDPRLAPRQPPIPSKPNHETPRTEIKNTTQPAEEAQQRAASINRRRISIVDYRRYTGNPTERDKDIEKLQNTNEESQTDEKTDKQLQEVETRDSNESPKFSTEESTPASSPATSLPVDSPKYEIDDSSNEGVTVKDEPENSKENGNESDTSVASDATIEFSMANLEKDKDFQIGDENTQELNPSPDIIDEDAPVAQYEIEIRDEDDLDEISKATVFSSETQEVEEATPGNLEAEGNHESIESDDEIVIPDICQTLESIVILENIDHLLERYCPKGSCASGGSTKKNSGGSRKKKVQRKRKTRYTKPKKYMAEPKTESESEPEPNSEETEQDAKSEPNEPQPGPSKPEPVIIAPIIIPDSDDEDDNNIGIDSNNNQENDDTVFIISSDSEYET